MSKIMKKTELLNMKAQSPIEIQLKKVNKLEFIFL